MISADEKTSIQVRKRLIATADGPNRCQRFEFEYKREGALAYIAAWDVHHLSQWYSNAILVHTPVHASWLNQIEIYFSVVQRKVLTPNNFPSLLALEKQLLKFQSYYNKIAKPFKWKFIKEDLNSILKNISYCPFQLEYSAAYLLINIRHRIYEMVY